MRQFTDMQERSALLAGASALRLRAGLITGASSNGMSVDEQRAELNAQAECLDEMADVYAAPRENGATT